MDQDDLTKIKISPIPHARPRHQNENKIKQSSDLSKFKKSTQVTLINKIRHSGKRRLKKKGEREGHSQKNINEKKSLSSVKDEEKEERSTNDQKISQQSEYKIKRKHLGIMIPKSSNSSRPKLTPKNAKNERVNTSLRKKRVF